MDFTPAWRTFRRMQFSASAAAVLIYAAAGFYAWQVLPGPDALKFERILLMPGLFLLMALGLPFLAPAVGRLLARHIWVSFRWGFGQTPVSVLSGIGVLAAMAAFIWWQCNQAASGAGRYPAGVFSGYAAGIGILIAQFLVARRMEKDPDVRRLIQDGGESATGD